MQSKRRASSLLEKNKESDEQKDQTNEIDVNNRGVHLWMASR